MENITFEQLPKAIELLLRKVENLEKLNKTRENSDLNDWAPLDIEQAAAYVKRKVNSVYQLVHENRIPHHKNGTLYFFKPELIKWIRTSVKPERKKNDEDENFGLRKKSL